MHPASTTKLLTAILLVENTSPNEQIVATESCEKVIGSSLRLKPGERVSSADMLKAIMLRSANDACHSIALHIAGSEKAFAEKMNSRAKALGARNSTFTNPHGLTAEGHRSTAFDLAMIGKAALIVPEIAEVAQLQEASITRSVDQTFTKFENRNRFLKHDPTATGLKTGYTLAAGNTFVGSVKRGEQTIITSILSSKDWFQDQINMTEWAFSNLSVQDLTIEGTEFQKLPVLNGVEREVQVVFGASFSALATPGGRDLNPVARFTPNLEAPIRAGQRVGTLTFSDGHGWKQDVPLVAGKDVARWSPIGILAWAGILFLCTALGVVSLRRGRRSG
jgi:D-alanyl-D-alanine carboxypeptidase